RCGIKKISAKPTLAPQTGWSLTTQIRGERPPPSAPNEEASRHCLTVVFTPPHEEGTMPNPDFIHSFTPSYVVHPFVQPRSPSKTVFHELGQFQNAEEKDRSHGRIVAVEKAVPGQAAQRLKNRLACFLGTGVVFKRTYRADLLANFVMRKWNQLRRWSLT